MALYRYEALDLSGKIVRGTLDAGTPAEARANLRDRGLHTMSMDAAIAALAAKPVPADGTAAPRSAFLLGGHTLDLLSDFSRHLAMLLKAGLPLAQSLSVLAEQVEDATFRDIVQDLAVRVREGASLDEALNAHPAYFPDLYVCVARAGAASGNLAGILRAVASYYSRQKKLRDRVVSALAYPALMCAIGLVVVTFLMAFVVPKVTSVLLEQRRALPWPTEVLLTISSILSEWWWALAGMVFVAAWLLRIVSNTEKGRRLFDRLCLMLPVLGNLFRKQAVARWADTMSNLLASGIPVAQALAVVKNAVGNRVLADDVGALETAVINGKDFSEALKESRYLPRSIGFVVGVGEETGELSRVLREVADSYNEEVELVSGRITDLINPILIVFLGVAVGFIVAAILLPITDFSQIQ
ncbi:MAG TPA: type II secretion system F family protein [Planctomycetota bacterium]|nr:type II secretion system F family protein [Planctomycetota bacterium]